MSFLKSIFGSKKTEATPPPALKEESIETGIGNVIKMDLKNYFISPDTKVMNEPIKAVIYSVASKIAALFIALVFPLIGYATFGMSLTLIDRVIVLNLREFTNKVIDTINTDCIQHLLRTVLGVQSDSTGAPASSKK